MENASKALLMAGGMLIAILVISLFAYLIASFGATSDRVHQQNAQTQIEEFNSNFTVYNGKENITIYDIVSVANLAKEYNKKNPEKNITVSYRDRGASMVTLTSGSFNLTEKIKNQVSNSGGEGRDSETSIRELTNYKVSSISYDDEGRVKSIYFVYV